ncbi:ATP-binding protein [Taibaiella koreensis]|uniref:ATP-binding protein n=1 Tax=Taibaiella koreensis TaxID=1268548 RepID=UPI000E59F6E2|nr:tetratricopeptide repeat-containing sensor histidine kinase [Taibaiella koreensis]
MRYIFILLLLCQLQPLFAQQSAIPDFDRIKDYTVRMDSLKAYCNIQIGSDAAKGVDFPQAIACSRKGIAMARKDDYLRRAHFALVAGIGYYSLASFDSALIFMKLSVKESVPARNSLLIAWSRSNLIPLYMQSQQAAAADSIADELKVFADTSREQTALAKCYYGLATYYYLKSYYATAQSYYLRSLEIIRRLMDTSADNRHRMDYAVQNYMLYKVYANTELYDKALQALKEGGNYLHSAASLTLRYYSAYVDVYTTTPIANIDSALHYYHLLEELPRPGKGINSEYVISNIALGQFYTKKGDFTQAQVYIDKATALADASKAPFLIHQVQNIKGIYKYHTGAYDEAIVLLEQAMAINKNVHKGNYLEDLYLIAQSYKAKGNLRKAMDYYDLYDREKDTFTKANMNRYFADLDVQYRSREKEKQISSLSSENQLRALELANASRLRLLLIAGLVALGIISLLLFRIYRNKEKLNKILNERNRELDQLNVRLALANESKARLFGIFSHDLRSPVSKIAQFLRLQKENPDLFNDNARSEYHEKFTQTTANLLNTMEDLLLWSKSQMENFTPEYHAVAIKELAERELGLLRGQAEEKSLHIDNQIPESFFSVTDENFVSIILRNLLQNAVRYSREAGTITLNVQDNEVWISNPSTSGMSAAALNELLQRESVSSSNYGLGLQIAHDLAGRIGIRLSFTEAQPGYITAKLAWERPS